MFRRVEDTLEPDPSFPADLKQLGFFINNLGHIRMIEAPEKQYVFHSTNNERVNEVRREAMQTCQREESEKRLSALGLSRIYLPGFTTVKPNEPHVPILAPPPEILKSRKRIIVLVNDALQDLGILAYRQLQRELGVNGGSVVNFVKEVIQRSAVDNAVEKFEDIFTDGFKLDDDSDIPALVVLNTGQLLYSYKHNQAMTMRSWSAMARKSVAHDMIRIHEENHVKGHQTPEEHVQTVFDEMFCNPDRVAPDAELYVIAIENGTESVLHLLAEDFDKYGSRIAAMALIHSLVDDSQIKEPTLRAFLHQRARQWKYSDLTVNPLHCTDLPEDYTEFNLPRNTSPAKLAEHVCWNENLSKLGLLSGIPEALHRLALTVTTSSKKEDPPPSVSASDTYTEWSSGQAVICPTFAGGENSVGECVFTNPAVQHAILSFFEEVAQDPKNYRNPDIKIYTEAPQPTPDNPLVLSTDDTTDINFPSLLPDMTPEQADLYDAQQTFDEMRLALDACPVGIQELEKGRERLVKKMQDLEIEIQDRKEKTLASGGFRAGEAQEKRENWKPQTEGPKVPFAGTMVDSELLKAAGLVDTAREEVKKLGDGDDEKAFI